MTSFVSTHSSQPLLLSFPPGTTTAQFLRREKRFTIHALLNGQRVQAHTNNSGSMLGLLRPGMDILLSPAQTPGRKLPYTLECVRPQDFWVGVNTLTPNRLLRRIWEENLITEFCGYTQFMPEARYATSRIDAKFSGPLGNFWVEAKNVTMVEDEVAAFPDAVTVRGQKHLRELCALKKEGARVGVFFAIQRPDGRCFAPAEYIDPEFARLFYQAQGCGVEFMPHIVHTSPEGIFLGERIRVAP